MHSTKAKSGGSACRGRGPYSGWRLGGGQRHRLTHCLFCSFEKNSVPHSVQTLPLSPFLLPPFFQLWFFLGFIYICICTHKSLWHTIWSLLWFHNIQYNFSPVHSVKMRKLTCQKQSSLNFSLLWCHNKYIHILHVHYIFTYGSSASSSFMYQLISSAVTPVCSMSTEAEAVGNFFLCHRKRNCIFA